MALKPIQTIPYDNSHPFGKTLQNKNNKTPSNSFQLTLRKLIAKSSQCENETSNGK